MTQQRVGGRFADADQFPGDDGGPHAWRTLGYRQVDRAPGRLTADLRVEFGDLLATGRCTQVVLPA